MNQPVVQLPPHPIIYPESDGLPMSDNTKQLRWIVVLYDNLAALFHDRPDVFVGGNQFWYPVEGEPELRNAPDVYVVFGRPKGDRSSYQQWREGGVPLTVVIEILSPGNTHAEMVDKQSFYEEHGAEEYYEYDPDNHRLMVYLRRGEALRRVRPVTGYVSPRLGIRFDMSGPELVIFRPDGEPFQTFEEVMAERTKEREQRVLAEQQAAQEREQRVLAERQAAQEREQRVLAERRTARLAELSRKARRQQASPEELAELQRLEQPEAPSA